MAAAAAAAAVKTPLVVSRPTKVAAAEPPWPEAAAEQLTGAPHALGCRQPPPPSRRRALSSGPSCAAASILLPLRLPRGRHSRRPAAGAVRASRRAGGRLRPPRPDSRPDATFRRRRPRRLPLRSVAALLCLSCVRQSIHWFRPKPQHTRRV